MKYFIVLSIVIFTVSAKPTGFGGEIDPSNQPGAFTTNANYSSARVPWGQAGFAATSGGTLGGNGGAVWTVWDPWALRDAISGNERREVYIRGRIDLTALFTGSPGVRLDVGSFKSIYGGDSNAMVFGGGLRVRQASQVIIENIKFHNALNYAVGEQPNGNGGIISLVPGAFSIIDALGIEDNTEYVWVHHCEFADDPWNAVNTPSNMRRHDGLIDIVRGANWISISNCIFRNHNHVSLIGSGDNVITDRNRLKVTWYHNWFQGTIQRNPRVRFGAVHLVNNLYTNVRDYAIGIGTESTIYVERNAFINTRRTWGWALPNWTPGDPTPANPGAFLMDVENRLVNSQHDRNIPSHGVTWRPYHYYPFGAMNAAEVEAYVRRYAGTR